MSYCQNYLFDKMATGEKVYFRSPLFKRFLFWERAGQLKSLLRKTCLHQPCFVSKYDQS